MKILPYLLVVTLLFCGCKGMATIPTAMQHIETGDLLFVGIPMNYHSGDDAPSVCDGDTNFIHTAILDVDSRGKIWIIDATFKRGVARYPLDTFLVDFTLSGGGYPFFEVMRLRDNGHAAQYVANAMRYVGEEYDVSFLPDNGRHYCTELIYDAYIDDTVHRFVMGPMDFKNRAGVFPAYWVKRFGYTHTPIPQGLPGTTPQEMRKDSNLERVEVDITNVLDPIE